MIDYEELENRFNCACDDMVNELSVRYKSEYKSGGHEKLSDFLDLIQQQFEEVEVNFINQNALLSDLEALRRIKAIGKFFAKKCVDDYGRII